VRRKTHLPKAISERPPWQRLTIAYAGAAIGPVVGAVFFGHGYLQPFWFSLAGTTFFYGGLYLFVTILTDLFRSVSGQDRRAMVSWSTAAVTMGLCALWNGPNLAFNVVSGGVGMGLLTWVATGAIIRRHLASLPPPPGAIPPPDQGDWSASSLRPH
jgi:hypothetical protein